VSSWGLNVGGLGGGGGRPEASHGGKARKRELRLDGCPDSVDGIIRVAERFRLGKRKEEDLRGRVKKDGASHLGAVGAGRGL